MVLFKSSDRLGEAFSNSDVQSNWFPYLFIVEYILRALTYVLDTLLLLMICMHFNMLMIKVSSISSLSTSS